MLIGIFATSFIVALSGALVPGPLFTVCVSESAKRGFWAGPLLVAGHGILEFLLLIALVLGFASFINNSGVLGIVGISGGLVLMIMGLGMIRDLRGLSLNAESGSGKRMNPVLAGIVASISNPYWTIWWVTIGLSYIVISLKAGSVAIAAFFIGHILGDLAWYSFVSWTVSVGRRFMTDSVYKGVMAFCAVFLLALGVYFGFTGLKHLL